AKLELDSRERDVLRREADLHLLAARLLLDEAEREPTVPFRAERRRAEDQRARGREGFARADAAAEQQRDLLGLRFGHERLVRRRGRRGDRQARAPGERLGVRRRALRLAAG